MEPLRLSLALVCRHWGAGFSGGTVLGRYEAEATGAGGLWPSSVEEGTVPVGVVLKCGPGKG